MFRRHEGHEDAMDMSMSMSATATATSALMSMASGTAAAAAEHSGSSMGGGHSMGGMSMGSGCKISMLWNWYTIDSCFISSTWHVKSKGGFAGTCIGVIALGMAVELVRRFQREYDRYIYAQHLKRAEAAAATHANVSPEGTIAKGASPGVGAGAAGFNSSFMGKFFATASTPASFTPSFLQQAVRALFYMLQFAGAYFIMLLAMYYNGYVIICIMIGAYLGNFLFGSDSFQDSSIKTQKTCCC